MLIVLVAIGAFFIGGIVVYIDELLFIRREDTWWQ